MNEDLFQKEMLKIGFSLTNIQLQQFERYYELLILWNEKMNLTGIIEKEMVYLKHFYDSATISQIIDLSKEETLCDVGTGAGFPGIVLKILYPHLKVTLLDSLNKRIEFLNEVILQLNLKDITTVSARAEEYAKDHREIFDVVTARAVAPLNILLEYMVPLLKTGKYFVAMKGNISREIIESSRACKQIGTRIVRQKEFLLPVEHSNRTLLLYQKQVPTDKKFPRKYSEMKKKPL